MGRPLGPVQSRPSGGCGPPGCMLKLSGGRGTAGPRARACIVTGPPLWPYGASAPQALPAARGLLAEVGGGQGPPPAPRAHTPRVPHQQHRGLAAGRGVQCCPGTCPQAQAGLRTGGPQVTPEQAPPPGLDLHSTGSVQRHSPQGAQGTQPSGHPGDWPGLACPPGSAHTRPPVLGPRGQVSPSPSSLCLPHDRPKNQRDEVLR